MNTTLQQLLVPNFLKKIDQKLLLSYPLVWNSKIHYVVYYTLLVWLAMAIFGLVIPNITLNSNFLGFYWLLSVLCVLAGIIIWLVFLFRHNSTKQFGNRPRGREWINLLTHYLCLFFISSVIYVMPLVKIFTAHQSIEKNNLVERINILNINEGLFPDGEYDLQQLWAPQDSAHITAVSFKLSSTNDEYGESEYKTLNPQFLNYSEVNEKFSQIHGKEQIKQGVEAYLRVLKTFDISHPYTINKITALMDDTLAYTRDATFEAINATTESALHRQIDIYFKPIHKFDFLLDGNYYFGWLLVVLPILLIALTIFRNTALKFYLISIGVTIVLVIVNAIFIGLFFSDYDNELNNYISLIVFFAIWSLFLFFFSTKVFWIKRYQLVNAYAVFLWNLLLPLLPLIFTSLFIAYDRSLYYHQFPMNRYYMDSDTATLWYQGMTAFGVLLFFAMQQLYFKPLYERLWALPK